MRISLKWVNMFSIYVIYFIILSSIILAFYWLTTKKKSYSEITSNLPTANGLPFLGVAFKILPLKRFLYGIAAQFEDFETLTYCSWLGLKPFIITIEPNVIKRVLTCDDFLNKSTSLYQCVDHAIPNGIIASSDTKWKHNRRLINPSFSYKNLLSFLPYFNKASQKIVTYFDYLVGKGDHQILEEIQRIIFEMGIETNMGFTLERNNEEDQQFYKNFKTLIENIAQDAVYSTLNLEFLIRNSSYYKNNKSLRDYIEKRIYVEQNNRSRTDSDNFVDSGAHDKSEIFFHRALNLLERKHFEIQDIISETHTLIAGSFETISTTLYSALVMLAMHPEVQKNLFDEITCLISHKNEYIDIDVLKDCIYLEMILNETMRLVPSIPTIGRVSLKPTLLRNNMSIPENIQVIIPIFALHRSKVLWGKDADKFCPENFYPENVLNRHPYAFIPFSKGQRNCIGWQFGIIALKICLIAIVHNYKFSTNYKYEDLKFVHLGTIKYLKEPKLMIERR